MKQHHTNMSNIKKITTPNKVEVEIKEWITGGEYEDIQKPITDIRLSLNTTGIDKGEINVGEAQRQSIENAIKAVVISVGGKKEDVVQEVKNLRKVDYLFVLKAVDKVVKEEDFTKPVSKQEGITG
jgi:hypothetical protein